MARGRTGRRPGDPGTRDTIRDAAARRFTRDGFQAATIRAIAADAGVDPALVLHYFGSKQELFVAAMGLPVDPPRIVAELLVDGVDDVGAGIVRRLLGVVDELGESNPMLGLLRSAATHPDAARMMRDFLGEAVLGPIAETVSAELGVDRPRLRAELCASQIVGIVFTLGVVALPTLATADREVLVAAWGPTLQRYLTAPLEEAI